MAKIAIVMGSTSDWPTMQNAAVMLKQFGVEFEAQVVSAHRTPNLLVEFAEQAEQNGFCAIIAGAGGADASSLTFPAFCSLAGAGSGPSPGPESGERSGIDGPLTSPENRISRALLSCLACVGSN